MSDTAREAACKRVGISVRTYAVGRDLLALAQYNLRPADAKRVREATVRFNESRNPAKTHNEIRDLILKVWGDVNQVVVHDKKYAERLVDKYMHQASSFSVLAEALAETIVPYLDEKNYEAARDGLERASVCLRKALRKLEEGR
jgi:hypothetical protein